MPKCQAAPGPLHSGVPFHHQSLAMPIPGVTASRWTTDELYAGMKDHHALIRIELGHRTWLAGNRRYTGGPGTLLIKQPGDIHRDIASDGPVTYQIIALPDAMIEQLGSLRAAPQISAADPRAAALHRLHDGVWAGADRLTLEVALAEALRELASERPDATGHSRPVARAIELLRARFADAISLDQLADHAGLDKFHLCRAFRVQVGMPPYAYLTRFRIMRAKHLLEAGVRPSEIAPRVGLYDQSQLNRHFRKIVGVSPGRYARRAG